jgi:hypothetical protein
MEKNVFTTAAFKEPQQLKNQGKGEGGTLSMQAE